MLKTEIFHIKLVFTETLVGAIGIVLFSQILLAQDILSRIISFFLFVFFCLVGYLLIKSTNKEIEQKVKAQTTAKRMKNINEELEERVKVRVKELQKSYEELKKSKEELERRTREAERKTEELEKFKEITVGREVKMIELKNKIEQLEKQLKKQ